MSERIVAALLLLALLPTLVLIGLVVRFSSPGPALFRQERVGRDGAAFRMLKFRTMVFSAEAQRAALETANEAGGPLFKLRHDPRITAFGRLLRRASLDEVPQLWHVVTGRMALVGPRPALPTEVECYPPEMRARLRVKPGLTGLWQVSGRSDLAWEEAVRLDLHYVHHWSPRLDLVILWRTVAAVVSRRGAY